MCAEKDPLDCHRTILVARELIKESDIVHILEDGKKESHSLTMKRLFLQHKLSEHDLFRTEEELQDEAYAAQEKIIAYTDETHVREASEA